MHILSERYLSGSDMVFDVIPESDTLREYGDDTEPK